MIHARVLVAADFETFVRKARINDEALLRAVTEIESGLVRADLGGNVHKQRIAREGEGKSGGYRALLVFRKDDRAIFVRGFAKNDQASISQRELRALRAAAEVLLNLTWAALEAALAAGQFREIEREANGD